MLAALALIFTISAFGAPDSCEQAMRSSLDSAITELARLAVMLEEQEDPALIEALEKDFNSAYAQVLTLDPDAATLPTRLGRRIAELRGKAVAESERQARAEAAEEEKLRVKFSPRELELGKMAIEWVRPRRWPWPVSLENMLVQIYEFRSGIPENAEDIATGLAIAARDPVQFLETIEAAEAISEALTHFIGVNRPLQLAVQGNDQAMVKLLLKAGADPNWHDGSGRTALFHVSSRTSPKVLEILRRAGANFQAKDDGGRTPIFEASTVPQIRYFLRHGLTLTERDNEGFTPQQSAESRYGYGAAGLFEIVAEKLAEEQP